MSSDDSGVDETGVDRMDVRIVQHMTLGALPHSDAVQALLASDGDVLEACARVVPREDPHFSDRLTAAAEAASAEADVDDALDVASPLGAAGSMQNKLRENNLSAGGDIDGVDAFDARRASRRASDLLRRASLADDEDEEEAADVPQIYARWGGNGKSDPNTRKTWTQEALETYFDKYDDVPSGPDFEAGGGSARVASELRKIKKRRDRAQKRRAGEQRLQALRQAGGIYSGPNAQFPTDGNGVITKVKREDWEAGGGDPKVFKSESQRWRTWHHASERTVDLREAPTATGRVPNAFVSPGRNYFYF
ncbi:unnamed protein product [Pelagomonas calceolata]|uniref:Uncharacterized protein n=1 Tax=Pelagomonas calceolata TaxID=35677 RepID=A0A8J2X016_9STRA|nr:unnamed protein product [Pelagomonas calceolata]